MACGEIKFLEGGVIKDSSILGGKMSGTDLSDCVFDAGYITKLKSLDSASAQVIAAALCGLDVTDLTCLANKMKPIILTDGTATRLALTSCTIKTLQSIDKASAKVIAEVLGTLTADNVNALAKLMQPAILTDGDAVRLNISDSTFTSGDITDSTIKDGTLKSNDLRTLASCDKASARVIAEVLGDLTAADVATLAELMKPTVLTEGTFTKGIIKTLQSIDATSAGVISDAIGNLSATKRKSLADKLLEATVAADDETVPDTTTVSSLPTKIYGDSREGMLGTPDVWFKFGAYLVPGYTVADGSVKV